MSVKRYILDENTLMGGVDMFEDDDGDYVLHSDYAALLARVVRLEGVLRFILDECDWEQHACGDNRIGTAARRALEEK